MVKFFTSNAERADAEDTLNKVNFYLRQDQTDNTCSNESLQEELRVLSECVEQSGRECDVPDAFPIVSLNRGGRVIVIIKCFIRKMIRWYVSEVNTAQVHFNRRVVKEQNQNLQLWKEQQAENEALTGEIAQLRQQLAVMEQRMNEISGK